MNTQPSSATLSLDLASFIENTPVRKQRNTPPSCLEAYASDIQELHKRGYSAFRIREYLSLKGVSASTALISRFTQRLAASSS